MQLLSTDDPISDDPVSNEERWSLYVDNYIQLSTTQGVRITDPFLRRNLPRQLVEEPLSGFEMRSGLELKICINTYKIFFVENTEDYFCRLESRRKVRQRQLEGADATMSSGTHPPSKTKESDGEDSEDKENEAVEVFGDKAYQIRREKFAKWLSGRMEAVNTTAVSSASGEVAVPSLSSTVSSTSTAMDVNE